jgi:hypothetical protein
MSPMRPVATFRLDPELIDGLKALYVRDGVPPSEAARRAIRAWLEAHGILVKAAPRRVQPRRKA